MRLPIRRRLAGVTVLWCEQILPRMRGSDRCEADGRRRADQTVIIPGLNVHSVAGDRLAASTSFGGQLPELLSSPLHCPVDRGHAENQEAREIPK